MGEEVGSKNKNVPAGSANKPTTDQRGTKESPLVIDVAGHQDTPAEAEEKAREKEDKHSVDRWTLRSAEITAGATVVLMFVGIGGVIAAIRTLRAIEKQAGLMETQTEDSRKSSEESARDIQASIAEAVRSAKAMEGVAESMATNAASVQESVRISREIADMQKLATTLQGRAYLSVFFNTATFQDLNHPFEAEAVMRNHGNTPAYDVTFRAAARIVPMPLPENFEFLLPDSTAGGSVSLMAPGTTKLIKRTVPGRVPDDQIETIKVGPSQCLAMWGIVNYRDAFNETRRVRFAFTVRWFYWLPGHDKDKEGDPLPPQIMSYDTSTHNDAD